MSSPSETPTPPWAPKPWVDATTVAGLRERNDDAYFLRNIVVLLPCQAEGCAGRIATDGRAVALGTHGDLCESCAVGDGPVPSPALLAWQAACPSRFRTGDTRTRLDHPEFNAKAYNAAKASLPTAGNLTQNLIIIGDTGASKSRMAWLLAYELMVRRGVRTVCLRGTEFRERIGKEYRDGDPEAYLAGLKAAPLLIWDDFGQDVLRDGTLADLRGVIDARYNSALPTFITTNFTQSLLTSRLIENANAKGDGLAASTAASITRRLWEDAFVITAA